MLIKLNDVDDQYITNISIIDIIPNEKYFGMHCQLSPRPTQ